MLETISDYMSIGIMLSFPILLLTFAIHGFLKKRKAKIIANSDKYYREW